MSLTHFRLALAALLLALLPAHQQPTAEASPVDAAVGSSSMESPVDPATSDGAMGGSGMPLYAE